MYTDIETLWQNHDWKKSQCLDGHNNLGAVLLQKGEVNKAIAHYQKALEINPKDLKAQANLASALAICPETPTLKGAIAVKLAQHANQITGGGNPVILHILAAAYAQMGGSPKRWKQHSEVCG
jgi:tetratricopeptide (TPR) repeat protein